MTMGIHHIQQGSGPDVMLLHAAVADHTMWQPQMAMLASGHRVTAYDLRGFGQTTLPAEPYAHHEDLRVLMDNLGIEHAMLVGSSLGGEVAINMAITHPERVAGLILIGPALEGYDFVDARSLALWAEFEDAVASGEDEHAIDIQIQLWLAGLDRPISNLDPMLVTKVREWTRKALHINAGDEIPLDPPAATRLAGISAMTRAIVGEYDVPDMHNISAILTDNIKDCRTTLVKGAGHLPSIECPDAFNALLENELLTISNQ